MRLFDVWRHSLCTHLWNNKRYIHIYTSYTHMDKVINALCKPAEYSSVVHWLCEMDVWKRDETRCDDGHWKSSMQQNRIISNIATAKLLALSLSFNGQIFVLFVNAFFYRFAHFYRSILMSEFDFMVSQSLLLPNSSVFVRISSSHRISLLLLTAMSNELTNWQKEDTATWSGITFFSDCIILISCASSGSFIGREDEQVFFLWRLREWMVRIRSRDKMNAFTAS